MKKFLPIFLLALLSLLVGCSTDGVGKPGRGKYTINGSVQKGPFVLGSTINIQSLNGRLNPTGQSYVTSTNDDAGHFDLGSTLSNKYAEIIATGYYFDEVVGDLSQGTLTLRSITDLSDGGNTNVNLLTTLVYNRTQNLVKNSGKSIADATAQAEQELFLALGIKETDIPDVRCAKMDISQAGDHNALLLTISVALQYHRSTAALSELIAKLAVDLADDGQIARDKLQSLYISESVDNLATQVRSNLIDRYNQLGAQNNVPHFDKYLGYFLDIDANGVADKIDFAIIDKDSVEFSAKGGEYTLSFRFIELENCEFVLSEGADEWLTLNTDGDVCQLSVDYNTTTEAREAEIIIKERNGDKSLKFYVSQKASFHIEFSCDAGANASDFIFISDAEHFTTELNNGNGVLLLTNAPSYIERIAGPFISISIPECVNSFTPGAFSDCTSLQAFNGKLTSADGRYLVKNGELLYYITNGLTYLTIPNDITTIGNGALYGSTMSGTVTIPASVTEIKDYAFAYCNSITLFKFESLTPPSLADTVFEGDNLQISIPIEAVEAYLTCDWPYEYRRAIIELADINNIPDSYRIHYTTNNNKKLDVYPEDVYTVLSHDYSNGQGIIVFFEPLTTIGFEAFCDCYSLTSVNIPDSVTTIGEWAFFDCYSLTSVNIPDSVTEIGYAAFAGCKSLTSVNIPDSVTKIGDSAFSNCDSLTSVNIPDSVTKIRDSAFKSCDSLTSVNIPDSVTWIGGFAFYSCSSLTSVTIPDRVTTIGNDAFAYCDSLTSVNIGDSVTTIGDSAFYSCYSLKSVNIPDSVTTIGEWAFYKCTSLTSVNIPDSVTKIGDSAFNECASLTSVTIGDSVTTIGTYAFYSCSSLTSVTIGDSVATIGVFAFSLCESLTSVYCEAITPPSLGHSYVFNRNGSGRKIYVPTESVNAYKSATRWNEYASAIVGYDF